MTEARGIPGSFTSAFGRLRGVPAQYTSDRSLVPSKATLDRIANFESDVDRYFALAEMEAAMADAGETREMKLLAEIRERKGMLEGEQSRLRELFRRFDNLYFPQSFTKGGADHWAEDAKSGRAHVSDNVYPVYVDIPASLQAVMPVENYVASSSEEDEREAAGRIERLYFEWKDEDEFELKVHKACIIKGLYGFTYAKVYWDAVEKRPTVSIIESPENLYAGWADSEFSRMDWAIYCYGISPQAAREEYGVNVEMMRGSDGWFPYVYSADHADPLHTINDVRDRDHRIRSAYEETQVEVYDYWYKRPPARKGGRPRVHNAILVGNKLVEDRAHPEYDELPYVLIPNTFIPNSPYGRPELWDIEQLVREKDERLTAAAQMIESTVGGQMWQLVGTDAPDEVPPNAVPRPNKVAAPGPGNELKALQPFIPQFAIEDYIKRIDAEIETVSGLNDLLIGRAPATILGSSKAIAALVANYEARIQMKRQLLYQARKRIWKVAAKVWERKSSDVREIIDGRYRIDVKAPELTPRDELEVAQMAINLVNSRLWTMERAMDRTGVDDPVDEKNLIREEQTDPTLNPAAVQAQASLMAAMQALGAPMPGAGAPTPEQTANAARQTQRPPAGTQSLNGEENRGQTPPEAQPANGPGGALAQTLVQGGEASGRILTQTEIA